MFWVKWNHHGQCRRFPVQGYNEDEIFRVMEQAIIEYVPNFSEEIAWMDEDGDYIPLLNPIDLSHALSQSSNKAILRVFTTEPTELKTEKERLKWRSALIRADTDDLDNIAEHRILSVKWNHQGGSCRLLEISSTFHYADLVHAMKRFVPDLSEAIFYKDAEGDLIQISSDTDLARVIQLTAPEEFLRLVTCDAPVEESAIKNTDHDSGLDKDDSLGCHVCDNCDVAISGIRYDCTVCENLFFCSRCEKQGLHNHHPLVRYTISSVQFYEKVFNALRSNMKDYIELCACDPEWTRRRVSWCHRGSCHYFAIAVADGINGLMRKMRHYVPDYDGTFGWQDTSGKWHSVNDDKSLKTALNYKRNALLLRLHTFCPEVGMTNIGNDEVKDAVHDAWGKSKKSKTRTSGRSKTHRKTSEEKKKWTLGLESEAWEKQEEPLNEQSCKLGLKTKLWDQVEPKAASDDASLNDSLRNKKLKPNVLDSEKRQASSREESPLKDFDYLEDLKKTTSSRSSVTSTDGGWSVIGEGQW